MNIAMTLVQPAAAFATRPAVCLGTEVLHGYADLARRAAGIAAELGRMQLGPGSRVAAFMSNRPEYLEILYGIWAAGHVAVPVNVRLHPRELLHILSDSGASVVFAEQPVEVPDGCRLIEVATVGYSRIAEGGGDLRAAEVAPDDLAWLFYTSGTTGRPKGAMLTHRNLWAMTLAFLADFCPITETSSALHVAPLSHAAGLIGLAFALRGAAHVIPESGGFDTRELAGLLRHHSGCSFFAAPTMLRRLVEDGTLDDAALDHLDLVFVGGAPLYVSDLQRALDALGPRIWIGYGQGEAPCTITYVPHHLLSRPDLIGAEWLGSVGIARSGVCVRVVDDTGADCAPGSPGEVVVKGDVVMAGYWNNAAATDSALRGGWLHTGDIGSLNAGGVLTLLDRSKDVIISGGSNIYPREVEEVLLTCPGVVEVSVVGRPHPDWGEEVIAFVSGDPHLGADDLDRHCLDQMARYKRPREYRFLPSLPKSSYGKILKTDLRKLL